MSGSASSVPAIAELGRAVERQRAALVAHDTSMLLAVSDEVVRLLEAVREGPPLATSGERDAFARICVALRANAQLLAQATSANARALAVLFDTSATYGRGGASGIASPSRPISAA